MSDNHTYHLLETSKEIYSIERDYLSTVDVNNLLEKRRFFRETIFPALHEWNKMLLHFYGPSVVLNKKFYLASFSRMSELDMALVCGLIDKDTYQKTMPVCDEMAMKKARSLFKGRPFTDEEMQSLYPTMAELFPVMMDKDVVLLLKKEYIPVFENLRQAGKLARELYLLPKEKYDLLSADLMCDEWFDKNDENKSEFLLLKGLLKSYHGLESDYIYKFSPEFGQVSEKLIHNFIYQQFEKLNNLPPNTIDEKMPARRQVMMSFLKRLIISQKPMPIGQKNELFCYLGIGVNETLKNGLKCDESWRKEISRCFRSKVFFYMNNLFDKLEKDNLKYLKQKEKE